MNTITNILLPLMLIVSSATAEEDAEQPNIVVIFSDDQGWADLSCQGALEDVHTPFLDTLGADGIRCRAGYVTAPQCSPSRAGLLTGRYQQRFGYDDISRGPLALSEATLADRLKALGYATGMVGKWHLEPDNSHQAWIRRNKQRLIKKEGSPWEFPDAVRLPFMPERRGFDEYFCGVRAGKWCRSNLPVDHNSSLSDGVWTTFDGSRTKAHTQAALRFIERRGLDEPFFLYLGYSIPHVPLEASPELLSRFPGEMPERRRYALAMLSEMDDGVGEIVKLLKRRGQYDNTLFFFASDNGAPLKLSMQDTKPPTLGGPSWDGSRNDPFSGEKGMLSEGGIRVPFLVTWKKRLPASVVFDHPISTLDIAATSLAAAGESVPRELDGVNLLPFLQGEREEPPHESLFWRFWNQAAVRSGDWKYLRAGPDKTYLFNLKEDPKERVNLRDVHPDQLADLERKLDQWVSGMKPPTLPDQPLKATEKGWYRFHIDRPGTTPVNVSTANHVERPNFLFITWEDVSPRLGCYGDKLSSSPTIDRLAAQGIRYDNAYSVAGVCAPSRSAIMSARWPVSLGSHHMRSGVKLDPLLRCFPAWLRDRGYYCYNAGKTDYNFRAPEGSWDVSKKNATWRARNEGQPFLGVYNFVETHQGPSQNPVLAERQRNRIDADRRVDPAEVSVPPYFPDTPAVRQQIANVYNNIAYADDLTARLLDKLEADGLAEDTIIILYGDHGDGIPRVKGHLYHESLRVPLIVSIPEKFRTEATPRAGSSTEELVSLMDLGPTALSLAGIPPPKTMDGRAFLGSYSAPERRYLFGHRDRVNSAYAFRRSARDRRWHYIRNFRPDLAPHPPVRGHVNAPIFLDAKRLHDEGLFTGHGAEWLEDQGQPEQLYDTASDPHCVNNLAADPEYQDKLFELRSALLDWQVKVHDLGFVPESLMMQRARKLGYPEKLYQRTDVPFSRLHELALAWQEGENGKKQILKSLEAVDAADRYWAVLGVARLSAVEPATIKRLQACLDDDVGAVARAATWALHQLGLTDVRTLAPIRKVLQKGNYAERLDAIQIARRIGPAASSLVTELERISKFTKGTYYDGYLPSAAQFALDAIRSEPGEIGESEPARHQKPESGEDAIESEEKPKQGLTLQPDEDRTTDSGASQDSVALIKDVAFAEGFGAAFIYGSEYTGGRRPPLGEVLKYREIDPWQIFLIPDGPVKQIGTRTHPWDFQEGYHSNYRDEFGHLVRELHSHRLVVNHVIEENSPDRLRFAQFNNYRLPKEHPDRNTKLVKRVTTDRKGVIRLYYNSQNEIRNAATGHSARWARDTWPHFLVNQRMAEPIALSDFDRLDFRVSYQVDQMKKLSNWPNAIRGAARSGMNLKFMFFLRHPDALEQKLFAGVMLFASNEKRYAPHLGVEQHGNIFFRVSVSSDGRPIPKLSERRSVQFEIRELVSEALKQGRQKQPELSAELDDYAIYNFSIGFEGMGHWETEAEISDLSLTGKRRAAVSSQD